MRQIITIGDVLETVEVDPEIREMFDTFSREESRWESDNDLPGTVTSRMFIATVNWARSNPKRWEAFFLHYYCDMSVAEIAAHSGHSEQYIYQLLEPVHYSEMDRCIKNGKKVKSEKAKG